MKKIFTSLFICAFLLIANQQSFAQQSGFSIGAMLNSPTGISMKGWINEEVAVDGAVSFNVQQNFSQFYLHSNVLRHSDPLNEELNVEYGLFRYYYGIGLRLIWSDIANELTSGLRTPIGASFDLGDSRVETFFELAPTIDFTPGFRFGFAGAFGMRVYLN